MASALAVTILGGFLAALTYAARTLPRGEPLRLADAATNRRLWSSLAAAFGLVTVTLVTGEAALSSAGGESAGWLVTLVATVWWGTLVREHRRLRESGTAP